MLQAKKVHKQTITKALICVFFIFHILIFAPASAWADNSISVSHLEKELVQQTKKVSARVADEARKVKSFTTAESTKLSKIAVDKAQDLSGSTALVMNKSLNLLAHNRLIEFLSDERLVATVQHFSSMSSDTFCRAYFDSIQGIDAGAWSSVEKGAETIFTIANAVTSASAAGAGSLTGYAGIASAVSQLGLGGITTTVAGLMGSNAAGAAATSVVTAAVGGPVVMGAILAGGTVATAYGTYELSKFSAEKFNGWAGEHCTQSASLP